VILFDRQIRLEKYAPPAIAVLMSIWASSSNAQPVPDNATVYTCLMTQAIRNVHTGETDIAYFNVALGRLNTPTGKIFVSGQAPGVQFAGVTTIVLEDQFPVSGAVNGTWIISGRSIGINNTPTEFRLDAQSKTISAYAKYIVAMSGVRPVFNEYRISGKCVRTYDLGMPRPVNMYTGRPG